MTFNRNDGVGLFKNDALIYNIGTFNGGKANFAADKPSKEKLSLFPQLLL